MDELVSLVDWSRGQFALTAMYHWIFVPITLGLTIMIAIMLTRYYKTGNEEWKTMTKFWMKLFIINFVVGVATGIILEFEFGTNWSNYSWFVGDIFGAPLAIEGILAFFMEATFIAVMIFGWDRVSKKFHLVSTWLVAIGSNLSALWILIANAWMQYPAGTVFNPATARNEMINFWDVALSPVAINKFLHATTSSYIVAALFVISVSSWYLLKKRNLFMAKKSMLIAAIFGLISSIMVIFSGDSSAYQVAQKQPMKLAAMEGLYQGKSQAGLVAIGILNPKKDITNDEKPYYFKIEIPYLLSFLSNRDVNSFVPGIEDLIYGNEEQNIMSAEEKMARGRVAIQTLQEYQKAKKTNDTVNLAEISKKFNPNTKEGEHFLNNYFKYFGYGYLNDPVELIPNVALTFYSFHIMVALGFIFVLLFIFILVYVWRDNIEKKKFLLYIGLWSILFGFIASQMGWIVAEVGRQPWIIQDLMPTIAAVTHLSVSTVQTTFVLFAIIFTTLLIAELRIMFNQIRKGPDNLKK